MKFSPTPVSLNVPHIPQRNDGECLVACSAMTLQYSGILVSYERLCKTLKIQPHVGAPFTNIQRLTRLGIAVAYRQGTLRTLHAVLISGRPCIVPVKTGELPYWVQVVDHAVVIVGMDARSVYLNDPAFNRSHIRVSIGDFDLAWLERDEMFAVIAPMRNRV